MRIIKFLLILIFFYGCSSSRYLKIIDYSDEAIKLPYKIESINIVDVRGSLQPMDWDVPMFAVRAREWNGNPKLSVQNITDIKQIIMSSESPDGIPVNVDFKVVEGLCRLRGDWKSVSEYAKFRAEIILKIPSENYTYKSYAEMFYDKPKLNGTEKGTLKLYDFALKNATYMALKEIKEELNKSIIKNEQD